MPKGVDPWRASPTVMVQNAGELQPVMFRSHALLAQAAHTEATGTVIAHACSLHSPSRGSTGDALMIGYVPYISGQFQDGCYLRGQSREMPPWLC